MICQVALPIWLEHREREMNLTTGTKAVVQLTRSQINTQLVLRISAVSRYRVYINGQYAGHGPSRGPHRYHRVDNWRIARFCKAGGNVLAIETVGYNVNSFYVIDAPSFLVCEVAAGKTVIFATGRDAVSMIPLQQREQKTQRYSFQRPFAEVWNVRQADHNWRITESSFPDAKPTSMKTDITFIDAVAPLPKLGIRRPTQFVAAGKISKRIPKTIFKDRSLTNISPILKGFPENQLPMIATTEWQFRETLEMQDTFAPYRDDWSTFAQNTFQIIDFGRNVTGFIGLQLRCTRAASVSLLFDEILTAGDVDPLRLACANIVHINMEACEQVFETFEPYTLRYLKIACINGTVDISDLYIRELACPDADTAVFESSSAILNTVFTAACETYRQNALDIFMDCPSRERAGWLCDSFWTARVGQLLSGHHKVETAFLENYTLPKTFEFLPDGMLPMCYPSDHNDGVYIANWSLWFILELSEFQKRGGSPDIISKLKPRVTALLAWFEKYRNADGLLEKIPSWVFIEWSRANDFVQDVNYPSNMLYAGALDAAATLYKNSQWKNEASKLRKIINNQSYDGSWYVDNAVRNENGVLIQTENRTETCQYYALFFGIASPKTRPDLWATLVTHFGPKRVATKTFPEIHASNAFIGNYLRIELLSRAGLTNQILNETTSTFGYMAERTGTLWENTDASASCNHGFASHVAVMLMRDALGLGSIDYVKRRVTVTPVASDLTRCEGSIPVDGGRVTISWKKTTLGYKRQLKVPPNWKIEIVNKEAWT